MASKYLQKYPVPAGFEQILHDFTRQILRDQPQNIVEYAASYFEMLEQGKKFQYASKVNVKRQDKKTNLQYHSKLGKQVSKKAAKAVNAINQAIQKQQINKNTIEQHMNGLNQKVTDYYGKQQSEQQPKKQDNKARISINLPSEENNLGQENNKPTLKQLGGAYQASTNTIVIGQGKKYVQKMNEQAANEVVNEEQQHDDGSRHEILDSKQNQQQLNQQQEGHNLIDNQEQAILPQSQQKQNAKDTEHFQSIEDNPINPKQSIVSD